MISRIHAQQDFCAGLLFIVIASAGLWVGQSYPMGTAVRMGGGYFPRILCLLLLALGLFICAQALRCRGTSLTRPNWRVIIFIPLAVMVFGLTLRDGGLLLSVGLATIIAGLASPATRFKEIMLTAAALALLAVSIFVWGIGLLIPILPSF